VVIGTFPNGNCNLAMDSMSDEISEVACERDAATERYMSDKRYQSWVPSLSFLYSPCLFIIHKIHERYTTGDTNDNCV
jgi:hypothetical protein